MPFRLHIVNSNHPVYSRFDKFLSTPCPLPLSEGNEVTLQRMLFLCPVRAFSCQPRATPWVYKCLPRCALKGQKQPLSPLSPKGQDLLLPFQGEYPPFVSSPRALPWAASFLAFQAVFYLIPTPLLKCNEMRQKSVNNQK